MGRTPLESSTLDFLSFPGPIHLITSDTQVNSVAPELLSASLLGFDTETRPAFKKGEVYPVSLLQLATETDAYLFRLQHIKDYSLFKTIFENQKLIKAGVAIRDDLRLLQKRFSFVAHGFIELQDLAKQKNLQNFGLKGMAEEVLGAIINKGPKTTNWDALELTDRQQLYAATDAWIGLQLYKKLC